MRAMNATQTTANHGHSIAAGDGERIWIVGDTMTLKTTGESSGGSLVLLENLTAPGGMEGFFRESGRPPTDDGPAPSVDEHEIARTMAAAPRYGVEAVAFDD